MDFIFSGITVILVLLILVVFRIIDKNNQGKASVRRYAEKLTKEIEQEVEEKAQQMKSAIIELDVRKKVEQELINRVSVIEDRLNSRADDVDELFNRVAEYDKAIGDLVEMTRKADENLQLLKSEETFLDTLSKRIHSANIKMDEVDHRIAKVLADFAGKNSQQINHLWTDATKEAQKVSEQLQKELEQSRISVKDFTDYITQLEAKRDEMESRLLESARTNLQEILSKSMGEFSTFSSEVKEELNQAKAGYKEDLSKYRSEVNRIQEDYRLSLNKAAETLRKHLKVSEQTMSDLNITTEGLAQKADEVQEVITRIQSYDSDIAALTKLSNEVHDNLLQLKNGAGFVASTSKRLKQAQGAISQIEGRIPQIEENLKKENSRNLAFLSEEVKTSIEATASRFMSDFEVVKGSVDEFAQMMRDYDDHKKELFESSQKELDSSLKEILSSAENLIQELNSNFKKDIKQYSSSMSDEMHQRFNHLQNEYKEIEKAVRELSNQVVSETSKGIKQLTNLTVESVSGLQLEADNAIEKTQQSFNLVKERMELLSQDYERSAAETGNRLKDQKGEAESILSKIKALVLDLGEKSEQIDQIYLRLDDYSEQMDRLNQLNKEAREGVLFLEQKKNFIDRLDSKIRQNEKAMIGIENKLPKLYEQFAAENEERVELSLKQITASTEQLILSMREELSAATGQVSDFAVHIGMLQNRREQLADSMFQDVSRQIQETAKEVAMKMSATLNDESLNRVAEINSQLNEHYKNFHKDVNNDLFEFKKQIRNINDEMTKATTAAQNEGKRIAGTLEEKYLTIRTGVDQLVANFQTSADSNNSRLEKNRVSGEKLLGDLEEMVEQLDSRNKEISDIYGRLDEIDSRMSKLSTLGKEAEASLEELSSKHKFVQSLSKLIHREESRINGIEKRLPEIESGFSTRNEESLKAVYQAVSQESNAYLKTIQEEFSTVKSGVEQFTVEMRSFEAQQKIFAKQNLDQFQSEITQKIQKEEIAHEDLIRRFKGKIEELHQKMASDSDLLSEKLKKLNHKIDLKLSETDTELNNKLTQFKRKSNEIESKYQNNMNAIVERTKELDDEIFTTLRIEIEKKAAKTEKEMLVGIEGVRTHLLNSNEELIKMFGDMRSEIALQKQESSKKIEELHINVGREIKGLENEIQNQMGQLNESTKTAYLDADRKMASFQEKNRQLLEQSRKQFDSQFDQMNQNIDKTINGFNDQIQKFSTTALKEYNRVQGEVNRKAVQLELNATKRLEKMESHLNDFEKMLAFRKNNLSTIPAQIDELASSLRNYMEQEASNVREDFVRFSRDLENQREIEKKTASSLFGDFRKSMAAIESDIDRIKSEAAQNVSTKLGLLEDDFFADIKNRTEAMSEKIQDWQKNVAKMMDHITDEGKKDRQRIEDKYHSDLALSEKNSIKLFDERLKEQGSLFLSKITTQQKAYDEKIQGVIKKFELAHANVDERVKETQEELTVWQEKIIQDVKNKKAEVFSDIVALKSEANENINKIKELFIAQKNTLTSEHKTLLEDYQTQVFQLGDRINQVSQEFEKRGVQIDSAITASDQALKNSLKEIRGEMVEAQRNLEIRIADAVDHLQTNVSSINNKIQEFLSQTKLFDRADSLKARLKEEIDLLRASIGDCENRRKELKETDKEFDRIRKIEADLSNKLNNMAAQRRKIEEMDIDFQRLLDISINVDDRIKRIGDRSDFLQTLEVQLRHLDELENDIADKYTRLDKKQNVIDKTLSGVDTNFEQMGKIEERFKKVQKAFLAFLEDLKNVNNRITILSNNKHDADLAVEKLKEFDKTMQEMETRMEDMQKARTWLAETETRLKGIYEGTQDQMKLLSSIMKTTGKEMKGATTLGNKELVLRLSAQGWDKNDISKTTGLAISEIEMILEIAAKTGRKK